MKRTMLSILVIVMFFSFSAQAKAQEDNFEERIKMCALRNGGTYKGSLTLEGEAKSLIEIGDHFEIWSVVNSEFSNSGLYQECLTESVAVIQSLEAESAYLTPFAYIEGWVIVTHSVYAAKGLGSGSGEFIEYDAFFYIEDDHFSSKSISDFDNPSIMIVGEEFQSVYNVITNVDIPESSYMVFCLGGKSIWQLTRGQKQEGISLVFTSQQCNDTGIFISPIAGGFGENFTQYDSSVSIVFPN